MKHINARTTSMALVSTALVAAIAGCSFPPPTASPSAPAPATAATSTPTETATETPAPPPEGEPLTIPDCETLLPLALAKSTFSPATEFIGENPANEYSPWYDLPTVRSAIADVSNARACWWGVPHSDGAFSLFVAEIDPTTRESIETALTSEGFSSVVMGTVTGHEAERDGDLSYEAETHLFTGDVWILADNGSLDTSGTVAGSALDALRTANPTRGL
jgi:hypothetical protein